MRKEIVGWILAGLGLLGAGCNNKDADQLGRVAKTVAWKLEYLTGGAQDKVASGLQAARASWSEATPEVRVAERLRWDKQLAETDIQIDAPSKGIVRLQGSIADIELRRRAVDLAQGTLGVEKVVDELGPIE